MNHSVYLFGNLEVGYTQYPDDFTKDIFQTAVREISDEQKITIHRDGSLIYYIYVRPLKTDKEPRRQYLGIAISFNGVYYENIKDIFGVFEEALTSIVITGKIVEFTEKGDIVHAQIGYAIQGLNLKELHQHWHYTSTDFQLMRSGNFRR